MIAKGSSACDHHIDPDSETAQITNKTLHASATPLTGTSARYTINTIINLSTRVLLSARCPKSVRTTRSTHPAHATVRWPPREAHQPRVLVALGDVIRDLDHGTVLESHLSHPS